MSNTTMEGDLRLHDRAALKRRRAARESGFTLIEVMVSSAVFSIGMAGIIALQIGIMQNNSLANDISIASNLATSGLERLKVTNFSLVVGTSTCPPANPLVDIDCYFNKGGQVVTTSGYFTRTWQAAFNPTMQISDVTVTVAWKFSISGGVTDTPHSIQLTGRLYPR